MKLNFLDSLKLFVISIPFFVALPANQFSDSLSVWRFLILILFFKMAYEKFFAFQATDSNRKIFVLKMVLKELKSGLKRAKKTNYYRLLFLAMAFLGIAVLSLLFSENKEAGIKKILFLTNIFLLFPIIIYSVKKKNDVLEIMKSILFSSAMMVLIGFFQLAFTFLVPLYTFWQFWAGNVIRTFYGINLSYLLSYSNTWFSYYGDAIPPTLRMFSTMPDSHSFAMFIIVSIPVAFSLLFYKLNGQKKFLSSIIILFFLAIFFSGSRGAWVGGVIAFLTSFLLFLYSKYPKFNIRKFAAPDKSFSRILVYFMLLLFMSMPVSSFVLKANQEAQLARINIQLSEEEKKKSAIFQRAISISDFSEISNKGRLQIWREAIDSIAKRPFLGVGFGNFPLVLGENISASKKGSSAHNIYLDIASEIGIIGLFAFLFLLSEIVMTAYDSFLKMECAWLKMLSGSFLISFIWILSYGFFDVVIFNDKVLMMVVIVVGILYAVKDKRFEFEKKNDFIHKLL